MKKLLLLITLLIGIIISGLTILSSHHLELFGEEGEEEGKEAGVEKEMMMWFQSRAYPDPYHLDAKYLKAWEYAKSMKKAEGDPRTSPAGIVGVLAGSWSSIGPNTGIGGRILSIAIDPNNGNNLFIGTASGGIWKSTNAGAAWSKVITGLPVLGVASIVYHPTNSSILYAGTGEVYRMDSTSGAPNPGNTGYNVWKTRGTYGVGLIKSTDGGATWSQVLTRNTAQLFAIQSVRFDPVSPNTTVYAAATDGLYRTTDAGATWTKILNKAYVSDVIINGSNNQQIIVAVGNLQNTDKGIYRSTDGGANWTKITSGLPASFQGYIRFDYVNSASNQNTIVASIGVSEAAGVDELYRTTNFGSTWSVLSGSTHCQWQYWCAHDVAINPSNTNNLVYGGVNWYNYTLPSSSNSISTGHSDTHDIKFDPSNNNIVYLACDGGMYKSTNGGGSFSVINNGLNATQFYGTIGVSYTNPNLIVGGLQDNGVVKYNGTTWSTFPGLGGTDGASCFISPTNDNVILASGDARAVYLSTNAGASSTSKLSYLGGANDSRTAFVAPMAISASSPAVMYVGSDNLHVSTNTGSTWTPSAPGTNYIEQKNKTAISFGLSPTDANKLYASTSPFAQFDNDADGLFVNGQPNILRTTTGNTPFTSIKSNLPDRFVLDFAISPTNDDSVWIVLGGFGTPHVWVSSTGGVGANAWTAKDPAVGGLPDAPVNCILIDPKNSNVIYVGNDFGVYVSPNKGATWQDFNGGFWDATQVFDLKATNNGTMLVAGTHGKGVFTGPTYNSLLPIGDLVFTATQTNGINKIEWSNPFEGDMLGYDLEKSLDGTNFIKIAHFTAKGQPGNNNYYFNDAADMQAPIVYYRLKSIETSVSYNYSKTVTIKQAVNRNSLTVLQNPVTGNQLRVRIFSSQPNQLHITLFDAAGQKIATDLKSIIAGHSDISIQLPASSAPGSYVIDAVMGNDHFKKRILKQ